MKISYKTRKRLQRLGIICGVLAIVAIVLCGGWVVWAGRYITYTQAGARLDMNITPIPQGILAVEPEENMEVEIIYREPELPEEPSNTPVIPELTSISGYYVNPEDLLSSLPTVIHQVESLEEPGTAVLLDMKNIRGQFYYETSLGEKIEKDIDQEQMSRLLEYLHKNDLYAIARIPAFRDREYGLNNVSQGLAKKGGKGALWMDDQGCYWLDPTNEDVLGYLVQQIMELKSMGFDEVVFTDFRFPNTEKIVFDGDRAKALEDAAKYLADTCAVNRFYVSFSSEDYAFPLPKGNCRLYLQNVVAADLPLVVSQTQVEDPALQLLFYTDSGDTRFNDYCVLRPLENAH